MRRVLLVLLAFGAGAAVSSQVSANDDYYKGHGHPAVRHSQDHWQLNHRAHHRNLIHQSAHYYGISPWQHSRLHADLEHDAYHDYANHKRAHYNGVYSPYRYYRGSGFYGGYNVYGGTGLYIQTPGFSFGYRR